MNAEIWFFFTPDGKHEITVLDKESALEVATLMSPEQRRQWKCRRNRSQEAWFVYDCPEFGLSEQPQAHKHGHSPVPPPHHEVPADAFDHQFQAEVPTQQWQQPAHKNGHQAQPQWQPPVQPQSPPQQQWQPPAQQQPQQWQQPQGAQQSPQQWQQQQPQAWQPPTPPPQQQQWQQPVMPPPQARQPAPPPPQPMPVTEFSAGGGREKRKHQRVGLRLRVVLIAGNRSFRTYSKDVSRGGMSFEHIVPKELIGQDCKVIIGSSDMKENLEFEAHIAGDASNPRAVEFHNAKAEFRQKLDHWLNEAKKNAA